ncbi:MAG TPA: hypothetical protein ENI42_05460, partial [Thermoplasmatales archaeon]|nr:hypothetical protein [Thermoplasmatales archaeon]
MKEDGIKRIIGIPKLFKQGGEGSSVSSKSSHVDISEIERAIDELFLDKKERFRVRETPEVEFVGEELPAVSEEETKPDVKEKTVGPVSSARDKKTLVKEKKKTLKTLERRGVQKKDETLSEEKPLVDKKSSKPSLFRDGAEVDFKSLFRLPLMQPKSCDKSGEQTVVRKTLMNSKELHVQKPFEERVV